MYMIFIFFIHKSRIKEGRGVEKGEEEGLNGRRRQQRMRES